MNKKRRSSREKNKSIKIGKQSSGILKYVQITLSEAKKWTFFDYLIFLGETLYNTILPFFLGYYIAKTQQVWWIFFLSLPIYINFKFKKFDEDKKTKKIYIK